ncbi:tripartite motif-containing protein 16-like [Labrus bergylta]|uniref:tripartite motif-containing protein 16-like n=1 Tax=Labrus bergylta TaxID=56723 RepID=UPI0033132796
MLYRSEVKLVFSYEEVNLRQSLLPRGEMAQKGVQLDRETFSCSICQDLLKDPGTLTCGHSYCMKCIKSHWDTEDEKTVYSCPQCRQTFTARPDLRKNTMLADLVEELKKTGLQAAPADHCYAGSEDVACDVCTGRKLKACKSCLFCLISFCEKHLQPHYEIPAYAKHKLVEPSKKLQENVCSRHDEVMKVFCRTDQQSICHLCLMDEHKGHDTVSAAAERSEKQRELEVSRQNIQQRIQDREKDVKLLQQEVEAINGSADKTVGNSEKMFTELIRLMEKRRSDVKQQVRSQQQTEVSRVRELQEKLEQEITELKRRDAEMKKLSHTQDHNQFLHDYPSLSPLSESTHSSSIKIRPLRYFEDVTAAVSEVRDKLQDVLREKWTNISQTVTEVDVLLSEPEPEPEPKTRAEFLKYSCDITLDPNTVNTQLLLSDGNRKVTLTSQTNPYSSHPDRFTGCLQVLSKESLSGRCYWEVEQRGRGVCVAVTYKNISRAGGLNECAFGRNDKSWVLDCFFNSYNFYYNKVSTPVSGPESSRVGVYLDHRAGILSFYSISETMTLLHRVQTTFTQPLHAGLGFGWYPGASAELCKLK